MIKISECFTSPIKDFAESGTSLQYAASHRPSGNEFGNEEIVKGPLKAERPKKIYFNESL